MRFALALLIASTLSVCRADPPLDETLARLTALEQQNTVLEQGNRALKEKTLPINWPERFSCTQRFERHNVTTTSHWSVDFAAGAFSMETRGACAREASAHVSALEALAAVLLQCADKLVLTPDPTACAPYVTSPADAPENAFDYNFLANNTRYVIDQSGACTMPGGSGNPNHAQGPSAVMVPDTAVWNVTTMVGGELFDVFTETTLKRHTTFTVSRSSGLLVAEQQIEPLGILSTTRFSDFNMQPASITLPAACNRVVPAFSTTAPSRQLGCGQGCVGCNCCSAWDRSCCANLNCGADGYKGQCC